MVSESSVRIREVAFANAYNTRNYKNALLLDRAFFMDYFIDSRQNYFA